MDHLDQWLDASAGPWIGLLTASDDDLRRDPSRLYGGAGKRVVRVLRGRKMMTRQALMDECGAALQLFNGFGENWHALNECLCYLDEWLPGKAYVLVLTDAHQILSREGEDELKWLLVTMDEVGEWWSQPVRCNDRFDRPALPFHVILRCPETEMNSLGIRVYQAVAATERKIDILDLH